MSAIHKGPRYTGSYQKLHTRVKVIVHSHNKQDPFILSDDVVQCTAGKNIKGVGQARVVLTPRVNFLNIFGPNDYVNIYFDKRDGYGWVRTFFGMIDRIEEDFAVSDDGTPLTNYILTCSDFSKIFDKTQYYTNPHLFNRFDITTSAIGDPAANINLMSNGLLLHGGPSDIVAQIVFTLLGFSGQYTVPVSYRTAVQNTGVLDENRNLRLNFAEAIMSNEQTSGLGPGGLSGLIKESQDNIPQAGDFTEENVRGVADQLGLSVEQLGSQISENPGRLRTMLEDASVSSSIYSLPGSGSATDVGTTTNGIVNIARGAVPGRPPTVLDLINIGSFVERTAMDGYTFGTQVPNYTGPILNLMRSFAHEIVNELFFDLRPVTSSGSGMAEGAEWSYDPDELGGNLENGSPSGVKYVPAMVMREYPFSTIEQLDGSSVTMSLNDGAGNQETYGMFPFGAIFSNKPNIPGRHIIPFPNINVIDRATGRAQEGVKHLDVAVISSGDIKRTTFGRSDSDLANLVGITSGDFLGRASEYYMKDLSPIITPIHIARHGLRVRMLSTRYARHNIVAAQGLNPTTGASTQTAPTAANPAQPETQEAAGDAYDYSTWHFPAIVSESYDSRANQPVLRRSATAGTRWGYVRGGSATESRQGADAGKYRMHNGVDIFGVVGTPMYAIADGIIEFTRPNGRSNIYGNMVYIRHPGALTSRETYVVPADDSDKSNDLWTLYAHLGRPRFLGRGRNSTESDMRANPAYSEDDPVSWGIARHPTEDRRLQAGDRVVAGQLIGYMGWTAGINRATSQSGTPGEKLKNCGLYRAGGPSGPVHVHFELNVDRRGRHYSSRQVNGSNHQILIAQRRTSAGPPFHTNTAIKDLLGSIDPVEFLQERGVDMISRDTGMDARASQGEDETDDTEDEEAEPIQEGTSDQGSATAQAGVENQSSADSARRTASARTLVGGVDSNFSRNVLARWILMQDLWYQHNLEYLSGKVEMARGAPEIRVGYRLDISDRRLSFYIEGVEHDYKFNLNSGGKLNTSLQVTRGQANNPYPAYILPRTEGFTKSPDQRYLNSRLGKYFITPDPLAVKNAMLIRGAGSPSVIGESVSSNELDTEATLSRGNESYKTAVESPGELTSPMSVVNRGILADQLGLSEEELRASVASLSSSLDGLSEKDVLDILVNDQNAKESTGNIMDGANLQGQVPTPAALYNPDPDIGVA